MTRFGDREVAKEKVYAAKHPEKFVTLMLIILIILSQI